MVQSPSWEPNRFSASHFVNPEGSLPHSQEPYTRPFSEPDQSSACSHPTSWRSSLILSLHLRHGLPSYLFLSGFLSQTRYSLLLALIRAMCLVHLILLGLIARTTFGEECKSWSSSLCSLLHSLPFYFLPLSRKLPPQHAILILCVSLEYQNRRIRKNIAGR